MTTPTDYPHADEATQTLLDGFPGGALLTDGAGNVRATNAAGIVVATLLRTDKQPEILSIINRAETTKAIVVDVVPLQGDRGTYSLEITALPYGTTAEENTQFLLLARDMTMEINLRSALTESRQRYKDLIEVSSDFSWETDRQGKFVFVTPKGALGYRAEDLIGQDSQNIITHPEDWVPNPFFATRGFDEIQILLKNKDGGEALVELSSIPILDKHDNHLGNRGICRDITLERQREVALEKARQRKDLLNYIVKSIRDELNPLDMLTTAAKATSRSLDAQGCCIYRKNLNGNYLLAAEHKTPEGIVGQEKAIPQLAALQEGETWETVIQGKSILAVPTRYHGTVNGAVFLWCDEGQARWDNDQRMLICDIANQLGIANEQISNHQRILTMSRTDALTGMLNRRAFFEEELPRRLKRLKKDGRGAALLYVDMDNFKLVNDVKGHQTGDDAILMLRDLLIEYSRPGDEMARLGGDEFAIWLDGIPAESVETRTQELLKASKRLEAFSGFPEKPLGISIGIAIYDPASDEGLDHLVSRADEAMYEVKRAHKGGYAIAPPPENKS